jgi:hypothetical protein
MGHMSLVVIFLQFFVSYYRHMQFNTGHMSLVEIHLTYRK